MEPNTAITTHLDIGLSKEDQDRIAALRGEGGEKQTSSKEIIKKINEVLLSMTKIKLQEKVTFYQLLAVMINAGVPIIRSLACQSPARRTLRVPYRLRYRRKYQHPASGTHRVSQHEPWCVPRVTRLLP